MSEQLANIDAVLLKFRRLLGHLVFSLPLLIGYFVFFLPLLTSYLIGRSRLVQSHPRPQDPHFIRPEVQAPEEEERTRWQGEYAHDSDATQAAQAAQEPITPYHSGYSETMSSTPAVGHESDYGREQASLRSEEQSCRFEPQGTESEDLEELRRQYEQ